MSDSNLQASLTIKAGVKGLETISKLSKEIEEAGVDVSELTEESQKLNKTFNELDNKQSLIDNFKEIKKTLKANNTEWQQAKKHVDNLKQAIEAQGTATKSQQAELKKAIAQEQKLKDSRKQYLQTLKNTQKAMSEAGLSTKNLAKQQAQLHKQTKATEQSLSELNNETKRLQEIAKAKVTLGIDTDDKARKQIQEATKAYELLKKSGKLSSTELARANELHTQKVAQLEQQLGKTAPTISNLTNEMGKLATSTAGLAVISKSAIDFEQAMAGVKKTVDGSPEQIKALSSEIQQLSIDLGLSSEAVADITAQGGQLGIPIEQLGKFTEMAGKMSVAFDMTAEEAAQASAKLANVFDIPIEQVESLGDAINTLGNNTAAKEREIVNAMLRIGGTAKQFGLAEEQAASLASAFIALGKPPEVAATAINSLLTKLQTAEGQSDKFQQALTSIGMSADQLAVNINENPQQALSAFLAKLGELDDKQRSMVTMQLFGAEYSDDISLLVGSLDTYNKALDLTADKTANAGAMNKEFDAQMSTTGKSIAQAKQSVQVLAQTLGQHLLPILATGAEAVGGIAEAINDFASRFPTLTQFGVLLASGHVALVALNSVLKLTGGLGLKTGTDLAKGFTIGKTAIDKTTVALDKLSIAQVKNARNSRTLTGDLKGMAGQMKTLEGLFAGAMAWEIGTSIGDSLYKNSEGVRAFGDELARGLAYLDAMVTERTFDDVRNNFETSAQSAQRLAEEQKNLAQTTQNQADKAKQSAEATAQQAQANRNLANEIIITKANIELMTDRLAQMERQGQVGSQTYKELENNLGKTQTKLDELNAKANTAGIGDMLKSDLEKASGAFQTLNLDIQEFSTGIDSQTTQALQAFDTVARLAEGNTTKLARAYTAVTEKVGDNAQAQELLNQKLLQVTQGNQQLADEVKKVALAQQQAKNATDQQSQALQALGINMDAINAKMSSGGLEMVTNLRAGITAIKEQATTAESLKTALSQALDVSLQSAKTKADFKAIQQVLQETGVASNATAEQMAKINAGAGGGEQAVKKLAEATKQTALENKQAINDVTLEYDKQANAIKIVEETDNQATASQQSNATSLQKAIQMVTNSIKDRLAVLEQMGATSEQVDDVFTQLMQNNFFDGQRWASFEHYADDMKKLNEQAERQVESFTNARNSAIEHTKALSSSTATHDELIEAKLALEHATDANIEGLIEMDSQTLSNLQNAIDSAEQKMKSFAESTENTLESLQAELAKLEGDNSKARQIEGARKLAKIESELAEARRQQNSEAIANLEKALEVQKKITAEREKQAKQREQKQHQSKPTKPRSRPTTTPQKINLPSPKTNLTVEEIINSMDARVVQIIKDIGADEILKKLNEDLKRSAIK